jgi:hypothetical protein
VLQVQAERAAHIADLEAQIVAAKAAAHPVPVATTTHAAPASGSSVTFNDVISGKLTTEQVFDFVGLSSKKKQ